MPRPKGPDRVQFMLRMSPEMRDLMESSAKAHGISMNSEVLRRLDASIDGERRDAALELGPALAIGRVIALAMNEAGKWAGMQSTMTVDGSLRWHDDPFAYDQAAQAGIAVIEGFRIAGPIRPQHSYSKEILAVMSRIGRTVAESVLYGIRYPKPQRTKERSPKAAREIERAKILRAELGELADRIDVSAALTGAVK